MDSERLIDPKQKATAAVRSILRLGMQGDHLDPYCIHFCEIRYLQELARRSRLQEEERRRHCVGDHTEIACSDDATVAGIMSAPSDSDSHVNFSLLGICADLAWSTQ